MGQATREIYWNIQGYELIYVLFLLVVAVFAFFFVKKMRLWRLGKKIEAEKNETSADQTEAGHVAQAGQAGQAQAGQNGQAQTSQAGEEQAGAAQDGSKKSKENSISAQNVINAILDVFTQRRVLKEKGPGLMHLCIFWGMLFCLVATTLVALQADFGIPIMYGDFYLYFMSLAVDLAGFVAIIGVIAALIRRASHVNKHLISKASDYAVLVVLLIILISGFMTEGLRIVGTQDPWAIWSPIGYAFSFMFAGCTPEQISTIHAILWWSHMALAFIFIGTFTYSKLSHVLFIPGNALFASDEPTGTLKPVDFEDEELETMGVRLLEEFTWKDLYDTQACVKCGRCEKNCPANQSGKQLSPRQLIVGLGASLEERGKILLETISQEQKDELLAKKEAGETLSKEEEKALTKPLRTEEQEAFLEQTVVGSVLAEEALWQCTTCRICSEQCPARVSHPEKIINLRTYQVNMESAFPQEAQTTFRNMEVNGNPWGLGWQKRADWAKDLDIPTLADNPTAEYLYWPGCSGAFDARSKKVTLAVVTLLKQAGVDFAILGNEEKCCGDSARRLGNEYLYYLLAAENIATLNAYGVKKIIVQCPHCMQALSVDYPQMGGNYQVIHHSQLLNELVAAKKLTAPNAAYSTLTYHDSCYLGRYNGIYEEPRTLLASTGAELKEMKRNKEKSFCCGAGGGHMWLEEPEGERINNMRAQQALETGAEAVCTACPFCLRMLTDGVAAQESSVVVKDIAEILIESSADCCDKEKSEE
ncbi:MAG: heterodisulfide reductase-related iron-sulfur binding cluster [Anaerotardibacter sp.]